MDQTDFVVRRNINLEPLWQGKPPPLSRLDIELTERCNNACLHCYINLPAEDAQAKRRELSTAGWKQVLDQAAELGALTVRMTGGEPLLREDFAELYTYARRLGMKVTLFTNARRISPELRDLFARIPPLEKIEVTVYGMHPESYDAAACCRGAYEEFRRGVSLLEAAQIPFTVKGARLPPNRDEVEELDRWAESLPGMEEAPPYSMFFDLRGRRDSEAKNRLIRQLRAAPEEGVDFLNRRQPNHLQEMQEFCSRFMGPAGDRLFDCGAGRSICVDAYGKAQPCMLLRDPGLAYDLKNGGLRAALAWFNPALSEMKATNPAYLERCGRCFLHGLCEQCPAKSWAEHGTLDTPVEYVCQIAHVQAARLGLLAEGERAWEVADWRARLEKLASQPG